MELALIIFAAITALASAISAGAAIVSARAAQRAIEGTNETIKLLSASNERETERAAREQTQFEQQQRRLIADDAKRLDVEATERRCRPWARQVVDTLKQAAKTTSLPEMPLKTEEDRECARWADEQGILTIRGDAVLLPEHAQPFPS